VSRGLGSLQRDILATIRNQQGTTTLETLRWVLNDDSGKVNDLSKSWTYGVERAVRGLTKRGVISTEARKLATLEEWVIHYPGKTHRGDIRQLRLDLLPVLAEWIQSEEGPRPLYSADENERFFARGEGGSLSQRINQSDRGILFAKEWRALEPKLRQHLALTDSDSLFYLIARGKHLFTQAPIQTKVSFRELVDRCNSERLLPESIIEELRDLAGRFLPPENAGALELKSVIYRLITSVIHGHPDLKPEAMDVLFKSRPDYLKSVPGFTPPLSKMRPGLWVEDQRWKGAIGKGSLLARLVDQTTFQKFKFLSLQPSAQKDDRFSHRAKSAASVAQPLSPHADSLEDAS
jgi:hypothetical protein